MMSKYKHMERIRRACHPFEYAREHGVCVRCGAKFEPNGHTVCPRCRKILDMILAEVRKKK